MSVNEYLDSLDDDNTVVYLVDKNLTTLPDLTRFYNLQELYCNYNQLTSLAVLPATLKILSCNYNQLTTLPMLPPNLKKLYCSVNQLTSLPVLPNTLCVLHCNNNKLSVLPFLTNFQLHGVYFEYNPIFSLVWNPIFEFLKKNIKTLYNFRYLYYCLKFKKQFRYWLWIRIREPKIREKYSSENLLKLLNGKNDEDLEQVLETW
jgi:Leucine-rich repeat (LRR) protein